MSLKDGPYGVKRGNDFDDGIFDGVGKIVVGCSNFDGVAYIRIEYVKKDGTVVVRQHGRSTPTQTRIKESSLTLNYPDEYISNITGCISDEKMGKLPMWRLVFNTSQGRCQTFGSLSTVSGYYTYIEISGNGTKLVGFHGRDEISLTAIGGTFICLPSSIKEVDPDGGTDGVLWDDGVFERVSSITVGESGNSLSYISFDYVKGNESFKHSHGSIPLTELKKFVLEEGECLLSVEGTSNVGSVVSATKVCLTSLTFQTSNGRSKEFGRAIGSKFTIEENGYEIVGFKGISSMASLNAIGANLAIRPPFKLLEAIGRNIGEKWDDGIHGNVCRIRVQRGVLVNFIKFQYVDGINIVDGEDHGELTELGEQSMFEIEEDDYITSMEVYFTNHFAIGNLKFTTNNGNTRVLGCITGQHGEGYIHIFGEKDHKIIGFHGKSEELLSQIGVYLRPI